MKKIVGYFTILLVYFWVTTANATIVATVTNSNGGLTIDGFHDLTPTTLNFLFSFDSGINGGVVNVLQPIVAGQTYGVDANFTISALAATYNVQFNQLSASNIAPVSNGNINDLLIPGQSASGSPLGSITVDVHSKIVSLDLMSALVGGTALAPTLLLTATETDPGDLLSAYLNCLDGWSGYGSCNGASQPSDPGYQNGSVTSAFTNANLTVVPEPTALLLVSCGLLTMLGFSRKSA